MTAILVIVRVCYCTPCIQKSALNSVRLGTANLIRPCDLSCAKKPARAKHRRARAGGGSKMAGVISEVK